MKRGPEAPMEGVRHHSLYTRTLWCGTLLRLTPEKHCPSGSTYILLGSSIQILEDKEIDGAYPKFSFLGVRLTKSIWQTKGHSYSNSQSFHDYSTS